MTSILTSGTSGEILVFFTACFNVVLRFAFNFEIKLQEFHRKTNRIY